MINAAVCIDSSPSMNSISVCYALQIDTLKVNAGCSFFVALCSPIVLRLSDVDDDDSCGGLAYCFFFLLVCKKLLFYVEVFSSLCVVVVAGVIIMLKLWKLHDCGANGWVFGSWK